MPERRAILRLCYDSGAKVDLRYGYLILKTLVFFDLVIFLLFIFFLIYFSLLFFVVDMLFFASTWHISIVTRADTLDLVSGDVQRVRVPVALFALVCPPLNGTGLAATARTICTPDGWRAE